MLLKYAAKLGGNQPAEVNHQLRPNGGQSIKEETHADRHQYFFSFRDPMTLNFDVKTIPLVGYDKIIPFTKFEDFGIIRF